MPVLADNAAAEGRTNKRAALVVVSAMSNPTHFLKGKFIAKWGATRAAFLGTFGGCPISRIAENNLSRGHNDFHRRRYDALVDA